MRIKKLSFWNTVSRILFLLLTAAFFRADWLWMVLLYGNQKRDWSPIRNASSVAGVWMHTKGMYLNSGLSETIENSFPEQVKE